MDKYCIPVNLSKGMIRAWRIAEDIQNMCLLLLLCSLGDHFVIFLAVLRYLPWTITPLNASRDVHGRSRRPEAFHPSQLKADPVLLSWERQTGDGRYSFLLFCLERYWVRVDWYYLQKMKRRVAIFLLRVIASQNGLTTISWFVGRAIRLVLATTKAVNLNIGFDQLNKVGIACTRGSDGGTHIVLSTSIVGGKIVLWSIDPALNKIEPQSREKKKCEQKIQKEETMKKGNSVKENQCRQQPTRPYRYLNVVLGRVMNEMNALDESIG